MIVLQEADLRLGARPTAVPHRLIEAETDSEGENNQLVDEYDE